MKPNRLLHFVALVSFALTVESTSFDEATFMVHSKFKLDCFTFIYIVAVVVLLSADVG